MAGMGCTGVTLLSKILSLVSLVNGQTSSPALAIWSIILNWMVHTPNLDIKCLVVADQHYKDAVKLLLSNAYNTKMCTTWLLWAQSNIFLFFFGGLYLPTLWHPAQPHLIHLQCNQWSCVVIFMERKVLHQSPVSY